MTVSGGHNDALEFLNCQRLYHPLANGSVGIKVIMELAGHRQMTTTQRYIQVTPEQKRRAVELI